MSPSRLSPHVEAALRRLVLVRAGEAAEAAAIAAALAEVLEALCRRFGVLVGESGIGAVLDRTLKERAPELALDHAIPTPLRRWPDQIAQLRTSVALLPAPLALDGSAAVVATFVGKVCTFIGETLTVRLLEELWPDAFTETT